MGWFNHQPEKHSKLGEKHVVFNGACWITTLNRSQDPVVEALLEWLDVYGLMVQKSGNQVVPVEINL